jgi:hypothetical protein
MNLFAFTIDLESDYGGVVGQYEIFKDPAKIEELLYALDSFGVKITVFSVAEIFELFPDIINLFEKYNCEFEPHSYSHNFDNPDSEAEIEKAKSVFVRYFNKEPKGYRAPRGKISDSGIMCLEKYHFLYDSSIVPSYFPNPFKYLLSNRKVHYYKNSDIMEIPFTSLSPLRLPLSVSYIKLLGLKFYTMLSLPDVACFGSHLHDFIIDECSFSKLPLKWKFIYNRNKYRGIELCMKYLKHVSDKGYSFCFMSEIYNAHKNSNP